MQSKQTPVEIYQQWKSTLKDPDESVFYYHPSLERIILGLSMYQIATRPLLPKLGKSKSLSLYNIYINEIVTAWIDDDGAAFDFPFHSLMTLFQAFYIAIPSAIDQNPSKKKELLELEYSFCYWCAVAGDISNTVANNLIDDITTDGQTIESEKISQLVKQIQPIVAREGLDLDMERGLLLIENFEFK